MKNIFALSLLLFIINVDIFGETIEKYQLKKAKQRVEHISDITKLSLRGTTNDMVSDSSLLSIRNIKISKTIAGSVLTARENLVLDTMEKASLELIKTNKNFNCSDIVSSVSNNISMTNSECIALNSAIKYFYNAGVYGITVPVGDILDTSKSKVSFDNLENSKHMFLNIKKNSQKNIQLEQKIEYMNDQALLDLCTKITTSGNKTLTSKENIFNKAVKRIDFLIFNGIGNITTLNSAKTKCNLDTNTIGTNYNFANNKFSSGVNYATSSTSTGDPNDVINAQIAELTVVLNSLIAQITLKENDILTTLDPMGCASKPASYIPCRTWKTSMNTKLSELQTLQQQKTDTEVSIATLRSQLK